MLYTLLITFVLFAMIRGFIITLLLAAIFSAIAQPLYLRILKLFRGRENLAAIGTLLTVTVVVLIPCILLLAIVGTQARSLVQSIRAQQVTSTSVQQVESIASESADAADADSRSKLERKIDSLKTAIPEKFQRILKGAGSIVSKRLSTIVRGTAMLFLLLFILIYTMFFFIRDGKRIVTHIRSMLPVSEEEQEMMSRQFFSVIRATIKGTFIIAIVQGIMGGLGFAAVGAERAALWGMLTACAAIIPNVGTALVWVPGAVFYIIKGDILAGVGLVIWFAAIVGMVDNLLRPKLVGNDTELHAILILLSSLGGLTLFGAAGIIIGPIVASVFVTAWKIFFTQFRDRLLGAPNGEAIDPDE